MVVMAHKTTSDRVLVAIGVLVALLVVVAVFFAVQPPTQFAADTPEGTAQGYFEAVNDHDQDAAESFMTEELQGNCRWDWWFHEENPSSRVVITDTEIGADTARVDVKITASYGEEPFGGSSYDNDETMIMVRHADIWLISEPVWPMDPYSCGEGDR